MNVKRIISVISIAAILSAVLFGTSAFADEAALSQEKINLMIAAGEIIPGQAVTEKDVKIKKDKAVEIARTILEDASAFEASDAYLNPGYSSGVKAYWSVNFYGKSVPGASANVSINADTGEITGYNTWNNNYGQQNYIAKYTRSEAQAYAENFLKNRLKYDLASYELMAEDPYANIYRIGGVKEQFIYNYTYIRKINGIPFQNDSINISVDGVNGKVTGFGRNVAIIDLSGLPSAKNVISQATIFDKYKQFVSFSLQYITQYQDNPYGFRQGPKIMLAYIPTYYTDYFDAVKGVPVNYDGSQIIVGNLEQPVSKPVPLNPDAVLPSGAPITQAKAETLAEGYRKTAEELLGVKFDGVNQIQQTYDSQSDAWSFSGNKNTENINCYFNISISKTTGSVSGLGFGKYEVMSDKAAASGKNPPEVKEKVTWSMGKEKALEAVKKIVPEQYGFYADQNLKEPVLADDVRKTMREYNYYFTRVVNGILFRDNAINISIDRETGEVKGFNINWTDAEFPQAGGIVTQEAATAKYFDGIEARLQYLQKSSFDQTTQTLKTDPVPMLVYSFVRKGLTYNGGMYIDASTGKLVDYTGREVKPAVTAAQQLGESWAKRSVELLISQGIIKNPFIDYDTELTRAEAVKMLSTAKGNQNYYDYNAAQTQSFSDVPKESEYFSYVENAVRQGIIAKGSAFKGDEKITREEFAVLLVNMTGYAELAGKTSIFKTDGLNAANPANAGYIAVCSALDFLPVKPGETFAGGGSVTLAEAAAALYKALSYIR
jgi:hypothetical protein